MKTLTFVLAALLTLVSAAQAQQVTDSTTVNQPSVTFTIPLPPVVVPPVPVSPFTFPDWVTVPYDASNFSGGMGTWSVPSASIGTNRYQLQGHTMHWKISLSPSTVSGATPYLAVKIPANKVSVGIASCAYQAIEGAGRIGIAYTFGTNYLFLYHADTTLNWQNLTNVGVNFTCTFEVQ